jgi:hypothetical protein
MKAFIKNNFLIILIVLLAFFLRIYRLDNLSLFEDELDIGYQAYSKLKTGELYVAPVREFNLDLVQEPARLPKDLKLVDTILYPSGAPAFSIFRNI